MKNQYYCLGAAYGIMSRALPQKIGTPAKISSANIRPVVGLATGMHLLLANRALTPAIDRAIRDALDGVDVELISTNVVSLDDQGQWLTGFYSGQSHKPLDDGEYLAAARTNRDLTQDDLSSALSVTKSAVSQWESGARKIPADKKEAIEQIFNIKF